MKIKPDYYSDVIDLPTEENGNFYFVKKYSQDLYQLLLETEGYIKTDIKSCAKGFRDCLVSFFQLVLDNDPYIKNIADDLTVDRPSVGTYIEAVARTKIDADIDICRKARKINRNIANVGAHWEEKNENEIPDYTHIKNGFVSFQNILKKYFSYKHGNDRKNIEKVIYREEYQPINNLIVYSTEPVSKGSCEAQLLCFTKESNTNQYYVVRQYSANRLSEFSKRDAEVLNKLWNESIQTPQGVVKYNRIESKSYRINKNFDKVFICYQLNGIPMKLSPDLIKKWSYQNKIDIISLLTDGINSIHKHRIYHRNLSPNSLYVYYLGNEVGINLVNFEFSKITGSEVTVIDKAAKNYSLESLFVAPELRNIRQYVDFEKINWEKSDIYSLGVLFAYIVFNGSFQLQGRQIQNIQLLLNRFPGEYPIELGDLIINMCSNIADKRPDILEVRRTIMNLL